MITLTTDFGLEAPFVGMMKGVMLSINPSVVITDITHGITPYNVRGAALAIAESYRYFPPKTVHLVVVDPGVGSDRRPIAASAGGHLFVGPDNGVLTAVFASSPAAPIVIHVTAGKYFLKRKGSTFHGRDVFAPVAAWLTRGVDVSKLGERITDYRTIKLPEPRAAGAGAIVGEVTAIDRFGNAITNIRALDIEGFTGSSPTVRAGGKSLGLRNYYAEAGDDRPHALINSSGVVEIFVYKGSAARTLGLEVGSQVKVVAG